MRLAEGLLGSNEGEWFDGVCYFNERYHTGVV
jgi:hypothetical protein